MATIKEDYCSKDIYRLLINKGFDGEVHTTFDKEGYTQPSITLQMAMKWLREVHDIAINIGWGEILEDKFQWWCIILSLKDGSILRESEYYTTYEEAAESSIKYCLEHLI
jgi:hypothetical protein